ncbi:hypothetical protein VTO42DRAFT_5392 [Malbranchea cinnamomea]
MTSIQNAIYWAIFSDDENLFKSNNAALYEDSRYIDSCLTRIIPHSPTFAGWQKANLLRKIGTDEQISGYIRTMYNDDSMGCEAPFYLPASISPTTPH